MTAKQQTIFAEQGARLQVTLTGAPIDLTGRLCSLQVRSSRGSSVIQLSGSTTDGRLSVSGSSVVVDIPASAMNMVVTEDKSYWVYNVEAWTTADDLIRAFEGLFQITRDVNRADGDEPSQVSNYLLTSSVQALTDEEKDNVLASLGITGAGGDVVGPASSSDDNIVAFDGATGKLLKGSGYSITSLLAAARNRASHTGTQLAATISDLAATVAGWLTWGNITGKPSSFSPSAHASTHATGGGDDVTPASIGAAEASHTHALSAITQSGASVGQAAIWNGSVWAPATISGGLPITHTAASGEIPLNITAHSSGTTGFRLARGSNLRAELAVTADIAQLRLQDAYGSSGGLLIQTVYGVPAFFVNGARVLDLSTAAAAFGGVSAITVGNAFGAGATYEVCAPTGDYGYASLHLRVRGGSGQASATAAARHGGHLALEGGAAGTYTGQSGNGGNVTIRGGDPTNGGSRGGVFVLDLPTADPHVAGQLWLNGTTPQISAG